MKDHKMIILAYTHQRLVLLQKLRIDSKICVRFRIIRLNNFMNVLKYSYSEFQP